MAIIQNGETQESRPINNLALRKEGSSD